MKKLLPPIALMVLFLAGCETRGDKFPRFGLKQILLGKINNHAIRKAYFINERTGFVAISKDTILKTNDSCKTFSLSLAERSSTFQNIRFADENIGFVIDRNNNVFKTQDGGTSWVKTRLKIQGAILMDIICLNKDTVFIAAGGNPQSKTGYIIKSSDGGQTWAVTMTKNIMKICFVDDSTGFASGYGGIIQTADCGNTWETVSEFPADDSYFFDKENGCFTYSRSLYQTTDGGKNWTLLRTIINPHWILGDDFSKIEGLNSVNGKDLIFTLNSRLIKVTPANKWFQHEFTRPYYQLQMIGRNKGIVYGFENLILVNFY